MDEAMNVHPDQVVKLMQKIAEEHGYRIEHLCLLSRRRGHQGLSRPEHHYHIDAGSDG